MNDGYSRTFGVSSGVAVAEPPVFLEVEPLIVPAAERNQHRGFASVGESVAAVVAMAVDGQPLPLEVSRTLLNEDMRSTVMLHARRSIREQFTTLSQSELVVMNARFRGLGVLIIETVKRN